MLDDDLRRLAEIFNIETGSAPLSVPALLLPPVEGCYQVVMQDGLGRDVRRYVLLHEIGHVLAGEADELVSMVFEGPLPESEDVVDLFALAGLVDTEAAVDGQHLEQQIRQLVPLDDHGWQKYRIPRLAKRLPRVRELVRDLHGYF